MIYLCKDGDCPVRELFPEGSLQKAPILDPKAAGAAA